MDPDLPPEPPPQNELDRLLQQSAGDPALSGRVCRALWEAELFVFVPDDPERPGKLSVQPGEKFALSIFPDEQEPFVPVFTSRAAANWAGEQLPGPRPAVVGLPGEAVFRLAEEGGWWVRINHGLRTSAVLPPAAVASMVSGEYRHHRPEEEDERENVLRPVPAEQVPTKLRQAIRVFCVRRPLAIAVYAFHPVSAT